MLLNLLMAIVFIAFSLTDFFDGYLARKNGQQTILGTVLDPIADKFLCYSTLIALLVAGKIFFFWVVILIGREFFMMGLRQIALEHNFSVPVSLFGKYKTAFQMVCLTFVIVNPYQEIGFHFYGHGLWNVVESILVWSTVILSVWSAKSYYQSFMKQLHTALSCSSLSKDV
jgi:CDP-diacylglycerol--glycerol-3-phosphate 3-phosphatidyltransferase